MPFYHRIVFLGKLGTCKKFGTEGRMLSYQEKLLICQLSCLLVDDIRNIRFTDIMQVCTAVDVVDQILSSVTHQMHIPSTKQLKKHIRSLVYQCIHDDTGDLADHHGMYQCHGITVQDNLLDVFQ